MGLVERLRVKWGVGLWGTIAILLAFALAGTTTVRLKDPILGLLLPADTSEGIRWLVYLVIIMPVYQVLLLGYGTLLGQGRFFWTKIKGIWGYLARSAG
jgi:hypothetical protein